MSSFVDRLLARIEESEIGSLSGVDKKVGKLVQLYNSIHEDKLGKRYYNLPLNLLAKNSRIWGYFCDLRVLLRCLGIKSKDYLLAQFKYTTKTPSPYPSGLCSATALSKYKSYMDERKKKYGLSVYEDDEDQEEESDLSLEFDEYLHSHYQMAKAGAFRKPSDHLELSGFFPDEYLCVVPIVAKSRRQWNPALVSALEQLEDNSKRYRESKKWLKRNKKKLKLLSDATKPPRRSQGK